MLLRWFYKAVVLVVVALGWLPADTDDSSTGAPLQPCMGRLGLRPGSTQQMGTDLHNLLVLPPPALHLRPSQMDCGAKRMRSMRTRKAHRPFISLGAS